MGKEEIIATVKSYLDQSLQDMEIENPKFDVKARWYNLNTIGGRSEFLKDTSAIANTFGPDGFIVIGFDDKTKTFHDASFSDSGLSDTSKLPDLLSRHIDRAFSLDYYETSIDEHKIGILHIPPSIDKPHVIRNYKTENRGNTREEPNKIFIRKNTQTFTAGKYDLELMYYDRKNIMPEYELLSSFHKASFKSLSETSYTEKKPLPVQFLLNIENTGRRPVSIVTVSMVLSEFSDPSPYELHQFGSGLELKANPIIVSPGLIAVCPITLYSVEHHKDEQATEIFSSLTNNLHRLAIKETTYQLTNSQIISSNLTIIN